MIQVGNQSYENSAWGRASEVTDGKYRAPITIDLDQPNSDILADCSTFASISAILFGENSDLIQEQDDMMILAKELFTHANSSRGFAYQNREKFEEGYKYKSTVRW